MKKEILGTMMNDGCEASGTILYLLFCFHFLSKISRVNHLRVQFWEIDPRFVFYSGFDCGKPFGKTDPGMRENSQGKILAQQVGFVVFFGRNEQKTYCN